MFTGVTLPFDAAELLSSAMEFIQVLGPFILLGLALALTPRIVSVIKAVIGRGKNNA